MLSTSDGRYTTYVPKVMGVMKVLCTSCALLIGEDNPYPTSQCRYVDISVDGRTLRPLVSTLDEYYIPRVIIVHLREPCTCEGSLIQLKSPKGSLMQLKSPKIYKVDYVNKHIMCIILSFYSHS